MVSAARFEHSPDSEHQAGGMDDDMGPRVDASVVILGNHLIRPWYPSAYPRTPGGSGRLYVCESCFKYTSEATQALGHSRCCELKHSGPLGTCLYQTERYSIHEVDGREHTLFCQSLSLFAKLFLDTKSICYNVQAFLFYILVEHVPQTGQHRVVGFFSKEKMSWDDYNLACILVFPPFQKLGLGKLLIAFSYELSKRERKVGSPEKPLSDLGCKGYMAYWTAMIAGVIVAANGHALSVNDISSFTRMHPDDIAAAMDYMGVLVPRNADEPVAISRTAAKRWARAPAIDPSSLTEVRSLCEGLSP